MWMWRVLGVMLSTAVTSLLVCAAIWVAIWREDRRDSRIFRGYKDGRH